MKHKLVSVLMAFALLLTLLLVNAMANATLYGTVKTTTGMAWFSEPITQAAI